MLKKLSDRYEKGETVVTDLIRGVLHELCPLMEVPLTHGFNSAADLIRPTANEQIVFPTKEQFIQKYRNRFCGAKVAGFEGVWLLNLKINTKRKEEGLPLIDLAVECAVDIEDREESQYLLFQEIVQYFNTRININRFHRGQLKESTEKVLWQERLNNIQRGQFVVPKS